MTAPPAKIKAFLAKLKNELLGGGGDNNNDGVTTTTTTTTDEQLVHGLLQLELLQRGMLVEATTKTGLMDSVEAAAGMTMESTAATTFPPMLAAASAAMAGRIAEQLAESAGKSNKHNKTGRRPTSEQEAKAALKRAKNDLRFQTILRLFANEDIGNDEQQVQGWLIVAEGYSARAAAWQPDVPVHWKKAWDCCCAASSSAAAAARNNSHRQNKNNGMVSRHAIPYILQLVRIAAAKQNHARVETLSLQLADCYLTWGDGDDDDTTATTSIATMAQKAFLPQTAASKHPLSPSERLDAAAAILSKLPSDDNEKNNVESSSSSAYLTSLRLRLLHQQQQSSSPSLLFCGAALANTGERLWRQSPVEYDALLVQHLNLLLAAGKTKQGDDGWQKHAVAFVTLVVMKPNYETTTSVVLESSSSPPVVDPLLLRQRACLAVPVLEWRRPGSFASTILYRACDFLHSQYLAARAVAAKSMTARPNTDANLQTMQSAINAMAAWLVLLGEEQDRRGHGTDGQMTLSPACVYAEECGVAYMELLVAWSGLHRPPWSQTGSAEARIIIQRARQSGNAAADSIDAAILVQLAEADAEGEAALDIGGGARLETARRLYERTRQEAVVSATVTTTDQQQQSGRPMLMKLVQARCLLGQALLDETHEDRWSDATAMIQESIACLGSINVEANDGVEVVETALHLWTRPNILASSIAFWTGQARQIHARILLRRGQAVEAQAVLENAVKDSSNDASASLGLGSFRLYKALFVDAADGDDATNAGSTGELKAAQVQLLKAAKLDSTQAGPFALLGYWYEYMGDVKRAAGCYSKALLLYPAQPVAGRGLIRLAPSSVLQSTFDSAVRTASTSSTNGWAWRAIGEQKGMVNGEDELAVVALLKALRCQDIVREKSDLQAPFYKDPKMLKSRAALPEQAATLWALAQCYRRLGRFTASIRTFNAAIEIGGEVLPSDLLRDCAQGLLEAAAEKYKLALAGASGDEIVLLAYGLALTLMLMAKRDHQDGKSGAAYEHLLAAIDSCSLITQGHSFACVNKLLGDLYSYGREIPLDIFPCSDEDAENLPAKLAFIAQGEACYRNALASSVSDETKASLLADIGTNVLLRAQLVEFHELKGLWGKRIDKTASLYSEAATSFRSAIEVIPDLSAAWCGLACSLVRVDPLLAQHAFIRSLQLDNKAPDTYANLSFLYTKFQRFDASTFVCDALTEVADTPAMWINRALVLEDRIGSPSAKQQAADAYRAALQVSKTPDALLGLAITQGYDLGSTESMLILEQYVGLWGHSDAPAVALHGTRQIEFASSQALHYATEVAANGAKTIELQLSTITSSAVDDDRGTKLLIDMFLTLAQRVQQERDLFNVKLPDTAWSLQRQVVNTPGDPTLWLRLTKSLLQSSALCNAEKTAGRAVALFETKLKDAPCAASKVAEACGLEQWIHLASKKEADRACITKLQRSLVMDPSNRKARKALLLLCPLIRTNQTEL